MDTHSKCILLNGFAGSGKTTIAKKYIGVNPFTLVIEGDEIITNIGGWVRREKEARLLIFELTKSMLGTHLQSGNSVVLPYLVTNPSHIDVFKEIAEKNNASFHEITLLNDREVAIKRLLDRGTWGEEGLDPLSEKDIPEIEKLYDNMSSALEKRPNSKTIEITEGDIEETYRRVLELTNQ